MTRTILISGAGSGFGKSVALGLARAGHNVIAGCHIWPQVTDLRAEAAREGLGLRVIKLDVLSEIDRNHALPPRRGRSLQPPHAGITEASVARLSRPAA